MNHQFTPSILDSTRCATCKFQAIAHTDSATCDSCTNVGPVELRYGNMLMCASCWSKEKLDDTTRMSPEAQAARVAEYQQTIEKSRVIDNSISVKSDLFNAETVSIVSLKEAIDGDDTIINKPFALATELMNRIQIHKKAIFENNQDTMDRTNKQRAIQSYINTLSNQLRLEEREKLKIADINYQPTAPKVIKPKSISTKKPKIDKDELALVVNQLNAEGIAANIFLVTQMTIMHNCSVTEAGSRIRLMVKPKD